MAQGIYVANADYEVIDRSPLVLAAGEVVEVLAADAAWPGWTLVAVADGRRGHVPDSLLIKEPDGRCRLAEGFDARDLSLKRGQKVESLRESDGWHWCRNEGGAEGWVPDYLLDPAL